MIKIFLYIMTTITIVAIGEKFALAFSPASLKQQASVILQNSTGILLPECPAGFVLKLTDIRPACYKTFNQKFTFLTAFSICHDYGSFLAEPKSQEEMDLLEAFSQEYEKKLNEYFGNIWIGISDIDDEGVPRYHSDKQEVNYTNWIRGDNLNTDSRDCVTTWGYGGWAFDECDNMKLRFFCQAHPIGKEYDEKCSTLALCVPPLVCNETGCYCPPYLSFNESTRTCWLNTTDPPKEETPKTPEETNNVVLIVLLCTLIPLLVAGIVCLACCKSKRCARGKPELKIVENTENAGNESPSEKSEKSKKSKKSEKSSENEQSSSIWCGGKNITSAKSEKSSENNKPWNVIEDDNDYLSSDYSEIEFYKENNSSKGIHDRAYQAAKDLFDFTHIRNSFQSK